MAAITMALCALASIQSAHAATTFVVTSTADDGSAGTLRAALAIAADGDVIDATGITGTIVLLPQFLTSSQLGVTKSVGIVGPGPDKLTIDGNHTSRVFRIFPSLDVIIDGFKIINGRASGAPPGSFPPSSGGGIYNDHSSLTVRNCVISENSADEGGGGIFNDGAGSGGSATLEVGGSTVSGNTAGQGGGIFNDGSESGSASLTVEHSRVSDNSASSAGGIFNNGVSGTADLTVIASTLSGNTANGLAGAILNEGTNTFSHAFCTVIASTISGNSAATSSGGAGGGIASRGVGTGSRATLSIANSTLSGNSAGEGGVGGGVDVAQSILTLVNSTLSGNSAGLGGGILLGGEQARLEIGNCILRAGSGENIANLNGEVISYGFNLSSDDGVSNKGVGTGALNANGDRVNIDPMLGPLADNGGPTLTHLPLPGSPAIDQGSSDLLVPLNITTDQRGGPRTVDNLDIANAFLGDGTDVGTVEVGAAAPPPPAKQSDLLVSLGVDKTSVKQGEQLTYTITVQNIGPDAATNVVVNDTLSSGTTFISAQVNKGNFTAPPVNQTGVVTWNLGDLANGGAEGAQLVVKVIIKGKTTVTNTATVSSGSDDPNPANNVAALTTTIASGEGGGGGGGGKKK